MTLPDDSRAGARPDEVASAPIAAVVYRETGGGDGLIWSFAELAAGRGLRLAGAVQRNPRRAERRRCDMVLKLLPSAVEMPISQDRGNDARGCRLDSSAFAEAAGLVETAIAPGVDLVVLSKFGKLEAEGGGFRAAIARAMELDIPAVIGVSERNLPELRDFAGGFAAELAADPAALREWLAAWFG